MNASFSRFRRVAVRLVGLCLAASVGVVPFGGLGAAGTASAQTTTPILARGNVGPAVGAWQTTLNRLFVLGRPSHAGIAVDNIFGPITQTSTRSFQGFARIGVDGVVGPVTRAAATRLLAAPPSPPPAVTPLLRVGSTGAAVGSWQSTLNRLFALGRPVHARIAVDGIFGPNTQAATLAFQRFAHIGADGVVGPITLAAAARNL